ncbi:MAG: serine hydrolase domain-containing protein, partial [Byssovorax cruenta]
MHSTPASMPTALADSVHVDFPSNQGPTDEKEVEAFIDGVIAAQLQAYHIPGAVVSVVREGELLFAKGYGFADLENRSPMLADKTLVRPGSTSKLFTWTAVMQLAEQGKVNINADVNIYLHEFKIPETFPEPITLAHLMTHTPGFENRNEGLFVRTAGEAMPLQAYLVKYMPTRIYPPGQMTAYSNYGTALAGYIVEQVSGISFEDYVEQNIFEPLGMSHSTFQRPVPAGWIPDVAMSYEYVDGYYDEQMDWVQPGPAGGLSSTATDMAKFMIAHLQDGRYGNVRILQEATARDMHYQHFTNDPRASGWTYGFSEANWNGQRILWHGGSTFYFHSSLVL